MRCITLIRSIISFPSLLLSISAAGIGKGTGGYFIFAHMHQMRTHECSMILMLYFTPFIADKIHEFYSTGKSPNFVACLPTQLSCKYFSFKNCHLI